MENQCNLELLQPGLSRIIFFGSNCTQGSLKGVSIYISLAEQLTDPERTEWRMSGENELYALLSFVFYHVSINIGCYSPSSVGFRYFCSARALITTVILRAGTLEKAFNLFMGESEPFVLSGDHQTNRVGDYSFRLIA